MPRLRFLQRYRGKTDGPVAEGPVLSSPKPGASEGGQCAVASGIDWPLPFSAANPEAFYCCDALSSLARGTTEDGGGRLRGSFGLRAALATGRVGGDRGVWSGVFEAVTESPVGRPLSALGTGTSAEAAGSDGRLVAGEGSRTTGAGLEGCEDDGTAFREHTQLAAAERGLGLTAGEWLQPRLATSAPTLDDSALRWAGTLLLSWTLSTRSGTADGRSVGTRRPATTCGCSGAFESRREVSSGCGEQGRAAKGAPHRWFSTTSLRR